MKNLTRLKYKGNVKVSIKIKDKIFEVNTHNEGLPALSRAFCQFITGNRITEEDIPQYLDLRYSDGETYNSCLLSRVHLSGKSWVYDSANSNYIAKFTGVISYNNLTRAITRADSELYRLYLYSGSLGVDSNNEYTGYYDLAFLDISAETLSYLSPGTQAIIEWSMELVNYFTTEE